MDIKSLRLIDDHAEPIYLQLYKRYRESIVQGRLAPGERVPSVRSLASELGVARGTVEVAYQMLTAEGYFETRGAAGTQVSPLILSPASLADRAASKISSDAFLVDQQNRMEAIPFQLGLPALDAFPRKTWSRLAGRNLRALETTAMFCPDPAGYAGLRKAIASYLGISRGIACSPEQVFVTNGYRGALELICHALLSAGDAGWYEDPGYIFAREFLKRAGLVLHGIRVDDEGIDVAEGIRKAENARFAIVTPTHQSPMGVALSLQRRLEILDWAKQRKSWIVEDDYDSEFRYQGRPLPALKSLDRDGRVIYTGSFSKVLFPGLRLAYVVVPVSQVSLFRDRVNHLPGAGSIAMQTTTAEFIEQGHFGRHLRKMRILYAKRRQYLVDAIDKIVGEQLRIQPQSGGIHVLAHLEAGISDRAIAKVANEKGLAVQALSDWKLTRGSRHGLLMGFANFATPQEAENAVRRLKKILSVNS